MRLVVGNNVADGFGVTFGLTPTGSSLSGNAFFWNEKNTSFMFATNNLERMRLWNTGNLLIQASGTFTDNGYRLDVQGTFRATGQVRLSGLPTSATGLSTGDLWNNSGVINIV
jgi:hypothetical protein